MRLFEPLANADEDADDVEPRELAILLQEIRETLAVEVLHAEVQRSVPNFPEVDDSDAIRVIEEGCRAGFAPKSLTHTVIANQTRVQNLDCNALRENDLRGEIYSPHTAGPDQRLDSESAAEGAPHQWVNDWGACIRRLDRGSAPRANSVIALVAVALQTRVHVPPFKVLLYYKIHEI